MTTLKGAYQRFVTSVLRFWKGEVAAEQQTEDTNEFAGTSPLVKVTKEPEDFESSVDYNFSTLTSDSLGPLIRQSTETKQRPATLCIDSDLLTSNYPLTLSSTTPQLDLLTPRKLTGRPKLKKSPTFIKLSPSLFRRPTKSTPSSPNIGRSDTSRQTNETNRQRSSTATIVRSLSSISKRFDGTLRKRTRIEAVKARRKAMEEIATGKDKAMSAEPFFARLRDYNTYHEDKTSLQLKWKQDKFGNHLIDGMLNIYWGLKKSIRLQTADSDVRIRPSSQYNSPSLVVGRQNEITTPTINETVDIVLKEQTLSGTLLRKKSENAKERPNTGEAQIIDIENGILGDTRQRTYDRRRMALRLKNGAEKFRISLDNSSDNSPLRQKSVILRKKRSNRSGRKTFSINGHAYNYETSVFTPEYGSVTNVRVTSKTSCEDVIKHLLNKFRVENSPDEFSLYLVKETQEQRELARDEYPLVSRIMSGPNEQVCKLYVMDRYMHQDITPDVAQYIKLDMNILHMFVKKFAEEQEREEEKMRRRFELYRKMLLQRIQDCEDT